MRAAVWAALGANAGTLRYQAAREQGPCFTTRSRYPARGSDCSTVHGAFHLFGQCRFLLYDSVLSVSSQDKELSKGLHFVVVFVLHKMSS